PREVLPRRRLRCRRPDRSRPGALRACLPRGGARPRVPARTTVSRLPAPLPAAVGGRAVQTPAPVPPLDGPARAAGFRALDLGVSGTPADAGGHARGEHEPGHRPHAPDISELAHA